MVGRLAWVSRGELDAARDNNSIVREILSLRSDQAAMHGYGNIVMCDAVNHIQLAYVLLR